MQNRTSKLITKPSVTEDRDLSPSLKKFDALPDSAHVRVDTVAMLYACSPNTVWRRSKAKTIPSAIKFGKNTTVWNVGQLRRDLAAKSGEVAQ